MKIVKFKNGTYGVRRFDWSTLSYCYATPNGSFTFRCPHVIQQYNTKEEAINVSNRAANLLDSGRAT